VHLACENGGIDNITLALVRVRSLGDDAAEHEDSDDAVDQGRIKISLDDSS
jgi:hypothetical protein